MKAGAPEQLEYSARTGAFSAQYSIQDVYDLLVELITNADDSYHELYANKSRSEDGGPILLTVERHKSKSSVITVADRAEGIEDLRRVVKTVGERTSHSGDRGFMGRGLKDCAALGHVTVETISPSGFIQKAEINEHYEFIPWLPSRRGGDKPTNEDRRRLGLPGRSSGTVVQVQLRDVSVPLLSTLESELPWHFALRDILSAPSASRLMLRPDPRSAASTVMVEDPEGELVADEEFPIDGYEGMRGRFRLYRSPKPLADQGDTRFRRSGILVKGRRGIYECSFLLPELSRDPAADSYFGRLDAPPIDALVEEWDERRRSRESHPAPNPRLLLDPNRRTGLVKTHPFTKALFQVPAEILRLQFDKEAQSRKQSKSQVEAKETTDRLRKLAREAARFMNEKLADLDLSSPSDETNSSTFAKRSIGIVPAFCQIAEGAEKLFHVRAKSELNLPIGTEVEVLLGKQCAEHLELVGATVDLAPDPMHEGILRGSFRLRGLKAGKKVQVGCRVDGLEPIHAEVQVVATTPDDLEIPNDFAFHRQTYTVKQGSQRTLIVRARFSEPDEVSPLDVRIETPGVAVLRSKKDFELVPGTTYYQATVTLQGRKLNGKTSVSATAGGSSAKCMLRVLDKEDEGPEFTFTLVPHSLGQYYRAAWSRKLPNVLEITVQHESVRRYLGEEDNGYPGQNLAPFRVLAAELISDNVCRRIAEERMKALPQEFDADKLYVLHNKLMTEFTPIAHRLLVQDAHTLRSG